MTNLEKLLNGIEVEWKPLGEVATIYGGLTGKSKGDFIDGNAFYISYKNIYDNIDVNCKKLEKVKVSDSERQNAVHYGDILFTGSSETADDVGMSSVISEKFDKPVYLNSFSFGIRFNHNLKLIPEFSKYLFRCHFMRIAIAKTASGVTRYNVSKARFKKILIPFPPISIQKEIAGILDKFTKLEAELEAELDCRKRQYDYYRNKLIDYSSEEMSQHSLYSNGAAAIIANKNDYQPLQQPSLKSNISSKSVLLSHSNVELKTLGEIGTLKIGRRFVRKDIQKYGVPCFHYGDLYTYYGITTTQTKGFLSEEVANKLRFAEPNDIVIVCAGENDLDIGVGVAWLGKQPAVVHDACCILHHNQNPRYISHFLRTHNYHLQIKKYVKNGKISSLPLSGLEKAIIPIPSLEEQERIASILDRFDKLCNDISEGLPAEIELRRKQYEYYRNKLLSFPNAKITQ